MSNYLGIELGSTRIKAVLINEKRAVIASGSHTWENKLKSGYWTYELDDVWEGIASAISEIKSELKDVKAIGVSAMMHGYLPFDEKGEALVEFRTWRNENTRVAAGILSEDFDFNIPLRWSIAHLYQAILDKESHVERISFTTTLAGYVHWRLTGEKVLGIGDASGMFPVLNQNYNTSYIKIFDKKTRLKTNALLPKILLAGEPAGALNDFGAKLLGLPIGTPFCPPEGDAGTGMVATNAIKPREGNVSAGTSIFAMMVLEKPLLKRRPEVDIVSTPDGRDVAMLHINECTVKIDPQIELFGEALKLFGFSVSKSELYQKLYETQGGKLGAHMQGLLRAAVDGLADGIKTLKTEEGLKIEKLKGHGGFFASGDAGRRVLSEALGIPIEVVSETGGPYGMAILSSYLILGKGKPLEVFLENFE